MSLYQHQFPYGELNSSTAFDSPLTLSALSPFGPGGGECGVGVDPLTTLDLSAIAHDPTATSVAGFGLNTNSVDRFLHLPPSVSPTVTSSNQYSPMSPDWPIDHLFSTSKSLSSCSSTCSSASGSPPSRLMAPITSSTTSVIVPNSSLSSSTAAIMSKSLQQQSSAGSGKKGPSTTSSTVSTIVMQSNNNNGNSSNNTSTNGMMNHNNNNNTSNSSASNGSSSSNNQQQQAQQPQQLCKVCGDIALGKNFGVVTCGSCKIFFRRNNPADKSKLQCRNNGRCIISKSNRRNCAACRLRKCADLGMKVKQSKQSKLRNSQDSDKSNGGLTRNHSQSSNSEDDEPDYPDLPSLIPMEEVEARLQARLDLQQNNSSLDLLDEVNSVILNDINAEHQHCDLQNGLGLQQENLAPVIEILDPHELNLVDNSVELFSACAKLLDPEEIEQLVGTSSTTATIVSLATSTSAMSNDYLDQHLPQQQSSAPHNSLVMSETNDSFDDLDSSQLLSDFEEAEEIEDDEFRNTNLPEDRQQLFSLIEEEEPYYEAATSANITTSVQPCNNDTVFNQDSVASTSNVTDKDIASSGSNNKTTHNTTGSNSCSIDLDSPECIERAHQLRLMQFYQAQPSILGCGYQNFQLFDPQPIVTDGFNYYYNNYRQRSEDSVCSEEEYFIAADGSCSRRQSDTQQNRGKRAHENEPGLELVKTEAKNLGSKVHMQINELCKLTSLIRIKLGIEYEPNDLEQRLYRKEMEHIDTLNAACRMIDLKPITTGHQCTHVYDSLRQGIFYANKTFKIFEEFWLQNSEMRELIRQDESGFDRKKNILLHMLYHLRGVYNFDEKENAWAVSNGMNENTFTYIKLTMFNESIKKEMTSMHHQYIHSFPDQWRQDPTIFNLMTFLLIFGAFEEMHSQFQSEKLRYFKLLYLVRRYLEALYQDKQMALQMLHWMLKLICDLSPLCSDCLTACTHSLNPQVLKEIGPSYAACLMHEMKQKKRDEEERRKRKHTRHSECSDAGSSRQVKELQQNMTEKNKPQKESNIEEIL